MKKYYFISELLFYMFDLENEFYIEVVSTEYQKRIMKIKDVKIFNEMKDVIENTSTIEISEEEFNNKLLEVKNTVI